MLGPSCVGIALALALQLHVGHVQAAQFPLQQSAPLEQVQQVTSAGRKLHGRFLHITDIHPDPFYNIHSDPDEGACHSKHGSAGYYGAEKTSCDSPYTLVNATFRWIQENLKDSLDFVIWTGDSARHDNDEDHPRHDKQVIGQNEFLMHKMREVFGKGGSNHINAFEIPVVPTIGNNDILPHNIFAKGPNRWTRKYAQMWHKLVPEEQKHQFEEGGWFFVEVIPNKLAVFSLNTMYFFNRNAAVDGCDDHSEPGYEQMEWLRIQLQFLRERGVKAIMSGHVPPARNDEKANWDETCWQKFTLWMQQYRDVIVGSMWGHMNIDHFLLHDFHEIERSVAKGHPPILADEYESETINETGDEPFHIADKADYLESLRHQWSKLPDRPSEESSENNLEELLFSKKKSHRRKGKKKASKTREHYHKEIGGEWAERYAVSFISPSIIPNFFPSLRVFEYNISGLEDVAVKQPKEKRCDFNVSLKTHGPEITVDESDDSEANDLDLDFDLDSTNLESSFPSALRKHKKAQNSKKSKKHKKKHKRKRAKFTVPDGPSPTAPPGPAYSPQTLSWLGYTEYYANLTRINNETSDESGMAKSTHKGGKRRSPVAYPAEFGFEVEYDSRAEKDVYDLSEGLFVRDLVDLAARIGDYKPSKRDKFVEQNDDEDEDGDESESDMVRALQNSTSISDEADPLESESEEEEQEEEEGNDDDESRTDLDAQKHKKHKKKKKKRKHRGKRQRIINKTWFTFVDRALVGSASAEDLHRDFGDEVK